MTPHASATCCWCHTPLVQAQGFWWCQREACRTIQREWAISFQTQKFEGRKFVGYESRYWFVPLPSQAQFELVKAPRKLWGGAAGPGKSFGARRLAIRRCQIIPNYNVLLLRKTFPELERTHIKALRRESDEIGFTWAESRKTADFPKTKASLECGHMEDADAVQKYLSTEYDLIIAEEGVQFDPDALMEVMSRARTSNQVVIDRGGAEVWIPTNPGGPSHALLRDLCITHTPDTERYPALAKNYRPEQWAFIPARLDDNPYIDPDYESLALSGLRKARYEQLRHGDWDAAEGQFFEMFSARTHARRLVLSRPLRNVVESVDWGRATPGAVAWYVPLEDNHWHVIGEWKFQRMTAEEVAQGIVKMRKTLGVQHVQYTVTDPSMHNKTGHGKGESYAETFARFGIPCRRGDNDRVMGWGRLAAAYRGDPSTVSDENEYGIPWLTYDPECKYSLRSIPALVGDKHNPEDVDTSMDDHAADRDRYFVMSRPPVWKTEKPPKVEYAFNTWGWWRKVHEAQEAGNGVLA